MSNIIHVIIADAQYLTRAGLLQLCASTPSLKVVGEASDAKELLELAKSKHPDVVVIDYNHPEVFPLDVLVDLKRNSPQTKCLIVTDDDQKGNIFRSLELGAHSFLTKNCSRDEILNALHATAKGEKFFCNKILDILLEKHLNPEPREEDCSSSSLSLRELEIVGLMAKGVATKAIADQLCLSTHTVYTHRKNIMRKLGVNSATELLMHAVQSGLVKDLVTKS